jgi:hypothetical protein
VIGKSPSIPLSDTVYNQLDAYIEELGRPSDDGVASRYNFWEATHGAGTLLMENIDQELK